MTGASLRRARRALGLTQPEFGRVVGLHGVTVSRFESGHSEAPRGLSGAILTAVAKRARTAKAADIAALGIQMKALVVRAPLRATHALLEWLLVAVLVCLASACSRTPDGGICSGEIRSVTLFASDGVVLRHWDDACYYYPLKGTSGASCFAIWTKTDGDVTACGTFVAWQKAVK